MHVKAGRRYQLRIGDVLRCIRPWVVLLLICLPALWANAQQADTDSVAYKPSDTAGSFVETLRKKAELLVKQNQQRYSDARLSSDQSKLFSAIRELGERTKTYLDAGIDTAGFRMQLSQIERRYAAALEGIENSNTAFITSRNLTATATLVNGLINQAQDLLVKTDKLLNESAFFRTRFDSMAGNSVLFQLPEDSVAVRDYLKRLVLLSMEVRPVDSMLKAAQQSLQIYTTRATVLLYSMEGTAGRIDKLRDQIASRLSQREMSNAFSPDKRDRPLGEAVSYSVRKIEQVIKAYAQMNLLRVVGMVVLIVALYLFLQRMKRNLLSRGVLGMQIEKQVVLHLPLASALLIGISVFQFAFPKPPISFIGILWVVSATSLCFVFWNFISRFWRLAWLAICVLFALAYANDLLLQVSSFERRAIVFLALAGMALCIAMLFGQNRANLKEPRILYPIALLLLLETLAFAFGLTGRFNLSKTLMSSGYFNVIVGITLLWAVRLINEMLHLSTTAFSNSYGRFFYLNFSRLSQEVPNYIYYFLMVGWFILFARNFYVYESIASFVAGVFTKERVLGSYTFTIQSIGIFFLILLLASAISRMVSFFASDPASVQSGDVKKGGIGSWMLLVRISIIIIGGLLAFAAAGIPMDRVTIIIGALGVGIGFGLQTLVNNLVSGLIIAFEKPVNVGDVVEIAGRSGVMKSIGFRSSIVTTYDGADVVIPNGDLLNQHLVNWTLDNHSRRIEIVVGVAYGTNLPLAKEVLLSVLEADERILRKPGPVVLVNNFSASSIDFRLLFWVASVDIWLAVRSDMLFAIARAFSEHGIEIPFQQVVVHMPQQHNENEMPAQLGKKNEADLTSSPPDQQIG